MDKSEARITPVEDTQCVFCKFEEDDWDESTEKIILGTGEVLCGECLRDMRSYKRYSTIFIRYSSAYSPLQKEILRDKISEATSQMQLIAPDDPELHHDRDGVYNAGEGTPTYEARTSSESE